MASNGNQNGYLTVDVPIINTLIESTGHKGTYINSAVLHPVHEYNTETGEFELHHITYDVSSLNLIYDMNKLREQLSPQRGSL